MGRAAVHNPAVMAVLFALSGAASGYLLGVWDGRTCGILFGALAAYLFAGSWQLGAGIVLLIDVAWIVSERSAILLIADQHWNPYLGMAAAGVVGGLGAGAVAGIGCRSLLSIRSLMAAGLAGCVAALPFGWWEGGNSDNLAGAAACFVIWQTAVGLTLWACSSRLRALPGSVPDR